MAGDAPVELGDEVRGARRLASVSSQSARNSSTGGTVRPVNVGARVWCSQICVHEHGRRAQVVDRPRRGPTTPAGSGPGRCAALPDAVRLHVRECEPEPRLGELRERRHERDVERGALLDPALGREAVEVAHDLGLARGVAGEPDPDVAVPPLVLPHASRAR